MSRWLRAGAVLFGLAASAALLFAPIFPVESGSIGGIHLDLADPPAPGTFGTTQAGGPPIPPNCVTWHEIFPNNCAPHHQDGYEDSDGNGTITPCDQIILSGVAYHVTWVGPTYFVTCFPPDGGPAVPGFVAEPEQLIPGQESPVCEVWHWIWPPERYCQPAHIDSWEDNGDGVFNECDRVNIFEQGPGAPPTFYHIDRIGVDIIVEPPTQIRQESSWGFLKDIFR